MWGIGALVVAMLIASLLPASAAAAVTTTAGERAAAASHAIAKVRSRYRAGAAGPARFDCSGLVSFAYALAGVELDARSSYDMWKLGARIKRTALKRGDLVWTWDRSYGHVGIYIGGGRYVHAPGKGRRVEVARLPKGRNYLGAVRP